MFIVLAARNIHWRLGMSAAEQEETVEVNTDVVFTWMGDHNVYKFPNKADFDDCDFTKATLLANNTQSPYTFKASSPGVFYFGCRVENGVHCKYVQQKLALIVNGTVTYLPLPYCILRRSVWTSHRCVMTNHPNCLS